jgi:glutamate 5-kinase
VRYRAIPACAGAAGPILTGMSRRAVVVKIGSSTLVDVRGRARRRVFAHVAADVAALTANGTPVVVVSSGAIALGLGSLGREQRPRRLAELQAASAIGQSRLLRCWESALAKAGVGCAQVLLTVGDIHRRDGYLNARRTLETLLHWGMVPVVNENDSTATDEITFGDNDALAAQVAVLLRARLLVLLTDIDGLYDRDPRRNGAVPIAEVSDHRLLDGLELDAGHSSWGSGGMRSKVVAAEMASTGGVAAVIASGHRPGAVLAAPGFGPTSVRCRHTSCGCATESRCRAGWRWTPAPARPWSPTAPACSRSACAPSRAASRPATRCISASRERRLPWASRATRRPICASWQGCVGWTRRYTEITLSYCEQHHLPHRRQPASASGGA